jgi:DNA-directed RNA polymerase subunit RPC12/RpoP
MFRIKQRTAYPSDEVMKCQDCQQFAWRAGLATQYGTVYLCAECADEIIESRESKSPGKAKGFANLLRRVFGKKEIA